MLLFEEIADLHVKGPIGKGKKIDGKILRAKVPGGWLVIYEFTYTLLASQVSRSITFVPDPDHKWAC